MNKSISPYHNTLFITLDSCRWDTYQQAKTPVMDKIGRAKLAETPGNYTLPAHASFFIGILPEVMDESADPYYTKDGAQLWRMAVASKPDREVGVLLEGRSIQEGYRKRNLQIRGFAGTSHFLSPQDPLRKCFLTGEFTHFSKYCKSGDVHLMYPRDPNTLPFSHIDEIADSVKGVDNWFIFINSNETHFPYHIEEVNDASLDELIQYRRRYRSGRNDPEKRYNYDNGGNKLHKLQVGALEFVDTAIGKLLQRLPPQKPILIVICGDHGEAFGENGYWGHVINEPEVLQVPLLINTNYWNQNDLSL